MKISLNKPHLARWAYWLYCYAVFVAIALVFGWHLHPRWDEIMFACTLPLWVIVPWAAVSLIGAALRSLWPVRFQSGFLWRLFGGAEGDQRLGNDTSRAGDRLPK